MASTEIFDEDLDQKWVKQTYKIVSAAKTAIISFFDIPYQFFWKWMADIWDSSTYSGLVAMKGIHEHFRAIEEHYKEEQRVAAKVPRINAKTTASNEAFQPVVSQDFFVALRNNRLSNEEIIKVCTTNWAEVLQWLELFRWLYGFSYAQKISYIFPQKSNLLIGHLEKGNNLDYRHIERSAKNPNPLEDKETRMSEFLGNFTASSGSHDFGYDLTEFCSYVLGTSKSAINAKFLRKYTVSSFWAAYYQKKWISKDTHILDALLMHDDHFELMPFLIDSLVYFGYSVDQLPKKSVK